MGVKKLFTFLNNNNLYKIYPYLNDLISELEMDKKRVLVGVDGNLFCYKYTHSYDNMLIGFFNQILKFLSNKIIPLYIFDGGTINEKENTNLMRHHKKMVSKYKLEQIENILELNPDNNTELLLLKKKLQKNSTKINIDSIKILLELFDLLNIPYLFSHGEGEYLAVLLNKYNMIDLFLTDDTDPIPAGINKTIKFYNNNVYYLDTHIINSSLNLSTDEFCDFCILLGSDYFSFNHGMKPIEIFNLIKKHKCIENIINNKEINLLTLESLEIINKIRNIYKFSDLSEKNFFLNNIESENNLNNINILIDHSNISNYSNIMLEFWDDFIELLKINENNNIQIKIQSDLFKLNINKYISKSKFNIKNIIKYIKNNIKDITEEELSNTIISFEFLNTFGI